MSETQQFELDSDQLFNEGEASGGEFGEEEGEGEEVSATEFVSPMVMQYGNTPDGRDARLNDERLIAEIKQKLERGEAI